MAASQQAGINLAIPKKQSLTESAFVRHTEKCPLLGCLCPTTKYAFISPDDARHDATRSKTGCIAGCLGRLLCQSTHDTTRFESAKGPDFEVKKVIPCYAIFAPCFIRCMQTITITNTTDNAPLGSIMPVGCCEVLASMICYGRNHALYTTKDIDNSDKYVLRADRTVYYHKYPVTGPGSQTPIAWVTITGRRAWCCGGLPCCYCGLGKSAAVEIDHERSLPFNMRAHLMSAAILQDHSFVPWVGCCCNEDAF